MTCLRRLGEVTHATLLSALRLHRNLFPTLITRHEYDSLYRLRLRDVQKRTLLKLQTPSVKYVRVNGVIVYAVSQPSYIRHGDSRPASGVNRLALLFPLLPFSHTIRHVCS